LKIFEKKVEKRKKHGIILNRKANMPKQFKMGKKLKNSNLNFN
jgi:hypothetical protein